jgi:hypothetical protein
MALKLSRRKQQRYIMHIKYFLPDKIFSKLYKTRARHFEEKHVDSEMQAFQECNN